MVNTAKANVVFPIRVNIPCKVTKPYSSAGLSYICQVIAHIAPIRFGTIANPSQNNFLYLEKLLILLITKIEAIHSNTLDI